MLSYYYNHQFYHYHCIITIIINDNLPIMLLYVLLLLPLGYYYYYYWPLVSFFKNLADCKAVYFRYIVCESSWESWSWIGERGERGHTLKTLL